MPTLRTFNLVLATLASAGKWKKAIDVSAPMRAEKDSAAAATGRGGRGGGRGARGRGGREDVANNAVRSVAEGLTADAETYTHLIVACGKGGETDRCVKAMYDNIIRRG